MYQPTASRSNESLRHPPSPVVSLVLTVLMAGFVLLVSAIVAAPAVIAAFTAGAGTAVLVTGVARAYADGGRRLRRPVAWRQTTRR
jgi:uncharacterized membrane protein